MLNRGINCIFGPNKSMHFLLVGYQINMLKLRIDKPKLGANKVFKKFSVFSFKTT